VRQKGDHIQPQPFETWQILPFFSKLINPRQLCYDTYMRKIFLFMVTSVDGYFEGPEHDIGWHMVDEEFNQFAVDQMKAIDTYLYGRKTYQLMESYWPNVADMPDSHPEDIEIGQMMGDTPKYVVSHNDIQTKWRNVTVIHNNVIGSVKALKDRDGGDIAIFGSNNLCVSLMQEDLVDEFRIMVCPIAIGQGTSLFAGLDKQVKLHVQTSRQFKNGNLLQIYRRAE
jgi:dihydrofolate reductase